ncbi:UDP-glycosyltransferase UGT5-like [Armigeres subalbatus]|uniref:UDP-glycosyltransferase UGT5-like n=1 Tax=Armigeres subalbatus TaxID=124917 RepID=UPI002ED08F3B
MLHSSELCLLVLVLVSLPLIINCDNILFLQSTPSRSHHIWNKQIFNRLYDNGHNLTILTFEKEQSVPGKWFFFVPRLYAKIMAEYAAEGSNAGSEMGPIENIINMYSFYEKASRILAKDIAIQQLIEYPVNFKFDLIIHDFTMGQFLLGFVARFGSPPIVSVSAFNIPSYTMHLSDVPVRFTTLPNYAAEFGQQMTITERCLNGFYWLLDYYQRQVRFMASEDARVRTLFGSNSKSVKEIEKLSSIVLVNSDFSMDYHQALPPNVIPVGGLHISRLEKNSPNILEFMDIPSKGVILLSFGTNIQCEGLGKHINEAFLKTFSNLPEYSFIWKHGDPESLGPLPPNVLVQKWIPQGAILSDPRTKLLIGHGGLLGLQEATWYGVPVIGIPFFADQLQNVDKLVRGGVGIRLFLDEINENSLKESIGSILTDHRYRQKMAARSHLFRSQPQPPLERAIFWIEKVLENKGLPYLASPAHDIPFYQLYGIDLIGATLLSVLIAHILCKLALSFLVNKQS